MRLRDAVATAESSVHLQLPGVLDVYISWQSDNQRWRVLEETSTAVITRFYSLPGTAETLRALLVSLVMSDDFADRISLEGK